MKLQEANAYLESFFNTELHLNKVPELKFDLGRVRALLGYMGHPQKGLKCVHVAGSKGKGSTCLMTAWILKEAGYRVGLYTSPHLYDLRERIRVLEKGHATAASNGIYSDMISGEDLCEIIEDTRSMIDKTRSSKDLGRLTFFEVYTALALHYFKKRKVDFAVLETGLGGRLDATNVVSSLVCAITPIGLEHVEILGDTLEAIAREKAAIIKEKGQKVICAPQDKKALDVIGKRCLEFDIEPRIVGRDISCVIERQDRKGQMIAIGTWHKKRMKVNLPLLGRHQAENAALSVGVIEALRELGHGIPSQAVRNGLENARWPGRFEFVRRGSLMLFDCAHTRESVKVLKRTISDVLPQQKITMVLGVSQDKDIRQLCEELGSITNDIVATKAQHPRANTFIEQDAARLFPGKSCVVTRNVAEALDVAKKRAGRDGVVLVTGSVFVVSEARKLCTN